MFFCGFSKAPPKPSGCCPPSQIDVAKAMTAKRLPAMLEIAVDVKKAAGGDPADAVVSEEKVEAAAKAAYGKAENEGGKADEKWPSDKDEVDAVKVGDPSPPADPAPPAPAAEPAPP